MKKISLPNGLTTIVDDEYYGVLSQFKWRIDRYGYVRRHQTLENGKRVTQHIHRFIMGIEYGDARKVDHIDGNPLNNQKNNLRFCSSSQNMMNRGVNPRNSTGLKGVSKTRDPNKWRSSISISKKTIHLGTFNSPEDAYHAYCEAAVKLHGEFANLGIKNETC